VADNVARCAPCKRSDDLCSESSSQNAPTVLIGKDGIPSLEGKAETSILLESDGSGGSTKDDLVSERDGKQGAYGRIFTYVLGIAAVTILAAFLGALFPSLYPGLSDSGSGANRSETPGAALAAVRKKIATRSSKSRTKDNHEKCLGSLSVAGQGTLEIIRAGRDSFTRFHGGKVTVSNFTSIRPSKAARAYFGRGCTEGNYSNLDYQAMILPGKTLSYEVNLSATNCGCSAVLSLVNMRYSQDPGQCDGDFYCNAGAECGVRCAEARIMSANRFTWMTSLHNTNHDVERQSVIFGQLYRPKSQCIDTDRPFKVDATVSLDASSLLVKLTQGNCFVETVATGPGLDRELRRGMTLALSYTKNVRTFGHRSCREYEPQLCPESVELSRFTLAGGYPR